ncbi:vitelline membrane outer layer protein 1-like [Zootoca vivipara]|uniref:vitelline membrane outer layer protein 1-like n=1 Tax=Zootoca vivipara TaxID=8524 RepID=UPI00159293FC|nr:vitelline membrane outer layer protein 1-like [Zootoca vivipara]
MDLSISTVLFMVVSSHLSNAYPLRSHTIELSVPNGGRWGEWGREEFCPSGHANGFTLKVHAAQYGGLIYDDTSLNGIRLHCTDGSIIESSVGGHGSWGKTETCPDGRLISFSLRVVAPLGVDDDTAADSIKFNCEHGSVLTGKSTGWGAFGPWSETCPKGAICGIKTRIDGQKSGDMTGLNDVKFYCCE